MNDWLPGLIIGAGLILIANFALVRFGKTNAKLAAAAIALATIGLYVPYSIVRWPGGDVFAIHLGIYLLISLACGMLLDMRASGKGLHWGPAAIISFFILVAITGAVFIAIAEQGLSPTVWRRLMPIADSGKNVTSVFPGVISHDFHQKETLYNQYLQQVEKQRERGWQVQKGWVGVVVASEPAVFRVAVQTREAKPVIAAEVSGQFLRPSDSKQDIAFQLREVAAGVYETTLALPLPGSWNLVLHIRKGEELHEVRAITQVSAR